jgi:hypothetical protein
MNVCIIEPFLKTAQPGGILEKAIVVIAYFGDILWFSFRNITKQ